MKSFRFRFTGRQARAIGITYEIYDTYKNMKSLGHALYKLYTEYELIKDLTVWETTGFGSIFDAYDSNKIPKEEVLKTPLIKHIVPSRETSPNTGTYKYYRMDAPTNYKW